MRSARGNPWPPTGCVPAKTAGRVARWARAGVLGLVVLGTGAAAHATAGGRLPGAVALLVLFATCTAAGAVFLGRAATTTCVVLLTVVGQTLVHGVLTATAGHAGAALEQTSAPPGLLPDVVAQLIEPVTSTDAARHLLADFTGPHAAMAVLHLIAAVGVGVWLAVGERAFWQLLRDTAVNAHHLLAVLLAAVTARPHAVLPAPPARPAPVQHAAARLLLLLLTRPLSRRGPPVLLGA